MKRLLFEFFVLVFLIAGTWFGLSRFDWVKIFNIEQKTGDLDEKIGNLLWRSIQNSQDEITNDTLIHSIDTLLNHLCKKNHLNHERIKLHLVENGEINAFALPDDHLVIYSGLIRECQNEAEFCGVLCHEMAHMHNDHVMNKLVKEMGLSVLISMTTGNGSPDLIRKTVENISSTAYDRKLETEADLAAADYMIEAGLDPEALANLLYRMADDHLPEQVYWISSHPESRQRAEKIMDYIKGRTYEKKSMLSPAEWQKIQDLL